MQFLGKGTPIDVPSDIADKLLKEYGAFFKRDGQDIVVSKDNTIKRDNNEIMYYPKPDGRFEEVMVSNGQEEAVEEADTDEEEEEEEEEVEEDGYNYDDAYNEGYNDGYNENKRNNRYLEVEKKQYGVYNQHKEPKKNREKILTGSDLNNFIGHICDYESGIKISNAQSILQDIEGLQEFRKKYVNKISGNTLELYWKADSKNPCKKFDLGSEFGIKELLDYQYEYSKVPENQKEDSGKLDLPKASHDGSLRKSRILGTVSHKLSGLNPFKKKTEQLLKYVAYTGIADNLSKILNFTKHDCHTSKGTEFVERIKNVWIPFLQADRNVSKEARKDNFVKGLNLFVEKVEEEQKKQYDYDCEQKGSNNNNANLGLLNEKEIFKKYL